MKTTLTAVAFAAAPLLAQAGTTLYGSIDAGVTRVSNIGGAGVTRTDSGNMQPDRIGVRGAEDLGDGYQAVYQLETGYATDTGAQLNPAKLFNRAAYVGLGSRIGTVTVGRQNNFMFEMVARQSNGVLTGSFYAFHPGNIDDLTNAGAYDNAVKVVSAPMTGLTLGAMLAPGEQAGDAARNRAFSLGASYVAGQFRAAAALSDTHNRSLALGQSAGVRSLLGRVLVSGPATGPVYAALATDRVRSVGVSASYSAGPALLHALHVDTSITAGLAGTTMKSSELGVNLRTGSFTSLNVGLARTALEGRRWNQLTVNQVYTLSRRTSVYAQALLQHASGNGAVAAINSLGVASGQRQSAVRLGVHHLF
jgi:predicted porin